MIKNESFETLLINIENNILKEAIDRDSRDNVSCIFICFKNFYDVFFQKDYEKIKISIETLRNTSTEFDSLYDNLLTKDFVNDKKDNKTEVGKYKETESCNLEKNKLGKKKKKNKILNFFCMCFGINKKKS